MSAGAARTSATATLELILTGNEGAVAVSGRGTCTIEDTRNNGRPCSYAVNEGDDLTLTPQGTGFVGWSVFECPGTGTCTIDVDSDRTVVATYTPTSLSVSVEGSDLLDASGKPLVDAQGNPIRGRVRSADGLIDCSGSNDCRSLRYAAFAEVVLTASPASEFERWSGACQEAGTTPTCTVLLSGNDVVGAKFRDDPDNPELIPPRMRSQLRVAVEPAGSGTVNSSRSRLSEAIACNPTCKARFQQGEKVTLEAVANAALGARFVQWQGGAPYCAAGATCRSFRRSTSRRSARCSRIPARASGAATARVAAICSTAGRAASASSAAPGTTGYAGWTGTTASTAAPATTGSRAATGTTG